jgi:hypothetical protein
MFTFEVDAQPTVTRWFEDPDTIVGVFENKDMSHPWLGHRVAFAFHQHQEQQLAVGQTRAPDNPAIGLGWRYVLVGIARSLDDFEFRPGGES